MMIDGLPARGDVLHTGILAAKAIVQAAGSRQHGVARREAAAWQQGHCPKSGSSSASAAACVRTHPSSLAGSHGPAAAPAAAAALDSFTAFALPPAPAPVLALLDADRWLESTSSPASKADTSRTRTSGCTEQAKEYNGVSPCRHAVARQAAPSRYSAPPAWSLPKPGPPARAPACWAAETAAAWPCVCFSVGVVGRKGRKGPSRERHWPRCKPALQAVPSAATPATACRRCLPPAACSQHSLWSLLCYSFPAVAAGDGL